MIYIFGGVGKTGCSSLAVDFANQFGLQRAYGGAYMREEAIKAGFYKSEYTLPDDKNDWDLDMANVPAFRKICERTGRNIDTEIEGYLMREMINSQADEKDIVVESKTMSRLLNSDCLDPLVEKTASELGLEQTFTREKLLNRTRAVWVHTNLEIRARRSLGKNHFSKGSHELSPHGFTTKMIEHEAIQLIARQMADKEDYSKLYGMTDYPVGNEIPPTTYGTILINNGDKETAYAQVLKMMGKFSE